MAITLTCLVASSSIGLAVTPDDTLSAARAAYLATDYEEALKILSTPGDPSLADQSDVYRALCMLALGRMNDVEHILRALAARNPSFRMSDADVTPRMIALYDEIRRATIGGMAREAYAEGKSHFDAGRFAEASARFESAIALLGPDERPRGEGSQADDLRQLARGFKELADGEVARARKTAADTATAPTAANAPALTATTSPAPTPETIIEGVVQRYALAYSALDPRAVTRVYPSENSQFLQNAFSKLKSQTIRTRQVAITLDPGGQAATVSMVWVVEAVPKVGSTIRAERVTTLRMTRSAAGDWQIVDRR